MYGDVIAVCRGECVCVDDISSVRKRVCTVCDDISVV